MGESFWGPARTLLLNAMLAAMRMQLPGGSGQSGKGVVECASDQDLVQQLVGLVEKRYGLQLRIAGRTEANIPSRPWKD